MADTWAQDIANQFKKRDNPKPTKRKMFLGREK